MKRRAALAPGRAVAGFTLLELLIVVAVGATVLAWGIPSWRGFLEKDRLRNAAEVTAGALNNARMEAIKRNQTVYVNFVKNSSGWGFGVATNSGCDYTDNPSDSHYCNIQRVNGDNFPGVAIDASYQAGFDPVRGTLDSASSPNTLTFSSSAGYEVDVSVNVIGSVDICSPSGGDKVMDYPDC